MSKKKERPTVICAGCGALFTSRLPRGAKYCTKSCAGRHTMAANRMVRIKDPANTPILKCCYCGKEISRRRSSICDSGLSYCDAKCAIAGGRAGRTAASRHKNGTYSAKHIYSKSKRGWRTVGTERVFFRSRMEANYARYLTFLGVKWKFESETFWFEGIRRGVMSYTPDFFLPEENAYIECKGWMDKKSATKLRRMAKYHPGIKITVVDWASYRSIERGLAKVIPDWEFYEKRTEIEITDSASS